MLVTDEAGRAERADAGPGRRRQRVPGDVRRRRHLRAEQVRAATGPPMKRREGRRHRRRAGRRRRRAVGRAPGPLAHRNGLPVAGRVQLLRRDAGERSGSGSAGSAPTGRRGGPRGPTPRRHAAGARSRPARLGDARPQRGPPGRQPAARRTGAGCPAAAPRPRVNLPDQAARRRARAPTRSVTRIPDGVWNQMTGRSWHRGCPVGRAGLRLLRINYWDYDGYRHRGELVAHADAVDNMRGALAEMYAAQAADPRDVPRRPVRLVAPAAGRRRLPVDGRRQHLGVQLPRRRRPARASARPTPTAARSTSTPGRTPTAPRTAGCPTPGGSAAPTRRVAWRSRSHAVVPLMARHGLRWTYGTGDTQHFDVAGRQRPR